MGWGGQELTRPHSAMAVGLPRGVTQERLILANNDNKRRSLQVSTGVLCPDLSAALRFNGPPHVV